METPDRVDPLGAALLARAREAIAGEFAIARELGIAPSAPGTQAALDEMGATFVTITLHGALRGCIGTLSAHRRLADDVRANAHAAAFRDPRFPPLCREEFESIRIEVSLLSAPVPMRFCGEADALAQLRPSRDGVVLSWHGRSATFLPQVWESLPDRAEFLRMLKRKAGLHGGFWAPDLKLERYAVRKWSETPAHAPAATP